MVGGRGCGRCGEGGALDQEIWREMKADGSGLMEEGGGAALPKMNLSAVGEPMEGVTAV